MLNAALDLTASHAMADPCGTLWRMSPVAGDSDRAAFEAFFDRLLRVCDAGCTGAWLPMPAQSCHANPPLDARMQAGLYSWIFQPVIRLENSFYDLLSSEAKSVARYAFSPIRPALVALRAELRRQQLCLVANWLGQIEWAAIDRAAHRQDIAAGAVLSG